jgi:hypothetical protein
MRIFNASPGFGSPLTESEVINFLTNGKLNIHIGTLDKKGEPNIHPTWYYFDGIKNTFYIETSKQSRKTENLYKNNIIYYCVSPFTISIVIKKLEQKAQCRPKLRMLNEGYPYVTENGNFILDTALTFRL